MRSIRGQRHCRLFTDQMMTKMRRQSSYTISKSMADGAPGIRFRLPCCRRFLQELTTRWSEFRFIVNDVKHEMTTRVRCFQAMPALGNVLVAKYSVCVYKLTLVLAPLLAVDRGFVSSQVGPILFGAQGFAFALLTWTLP